MLGGMLILHYFLLGFYCLAGFCWRCGGLLSCHQRLGPLLIRFGGECAWVGGFEGLVLYWYCGIGIGIDLIRLDWFVGTVILCVDEGVRGWRC